MGITTGIGWTDATHNEVWGCTRVSRGCDRCYAANFAARFNQSWGQKEYKTFGEKHLNQPILWNDACAAAGLRRRVFCGSMCDVFDKDWPAGVRERLWARIERCPQLDWQLVTKRVGNVVKMVPPAWLEPGRWPRHVWIISSMVNQEEFNRDIDRLRAVPAWVRGISFEPLVGAIDVDQHPRGLQGIAWIITGGETQPGAEPCHPQWVRDLMAAGTRYGCARFHKQWGDWLPGRIVTRGASLGGGAIGMVSSFAEFPDSPVPGELYSGKRTHWWDGTSAFNPGPISVLVGAKAAGNLVDGVRIEEFPGERHGALV